jgi:hypothetical protein
MMNRKSYIIASIVVGIVAWILDFLLHGLILADAYQQNVALFGSMEQMTKYMWLSPVAYFSYSFVAGYIYIKWMDAGGLMEGLHFGTCMAILLAVPRFCFEVMYFPYPKIFDIANLIQGLIKFILMGIIFAVMYKPVTDKR